MRAILFALAISFWDLFKSLRADVIFGRDKYLDNIVAFGETHLRWILSSYAAYYNQARTHLALQKDSPDLVGSLPSPSWAGCITNTFGYVFGRDIC